LKCKGEKENRYQSLLTASYSHQLATASQKNVFACSHGNNAKMRKKYEPYFLLLGCTFFKPP
jgi:hypothetical protein